MEEDYNKREKLGLEPRIVKDFKNKELKKCIKTFYKVKF